jgi:serine/threonine-protein kinase
MSDETRTGIESLPLPLAYHINRVCDHYEAACRAGRRPRIEDYVQFEAEPGRAALLRELLAAELAARVHLGETPTPQEYRARFPGETELIGDVFGESGASPGPPAPAADEINCLSEPDDTPRVGLPGDPAGRADLAVAGRGRRFRILRPHARGGLGEIFVAYDDELHREVALKEIRLDRAEQPRGRERFLLEAEVTGGLEHPGIVPVYGLGHYDDGRPYYTMRLIKGESLKEAIARFHGAQGPRSDPGERALALRQLLRRFVDACNALAYAHSRGVLHRDVKPSNILLGPYGETLVVDWGLAKAFGKADDAADTPEAPLRPESGRECELTQTGSALGTPQYMSPEQAAGDPSRLGPRSDVYSLGATLYCLLTGQAPFAAEDVLGVLDDVRAGAFPPPRRLDATVDRALEAVCLKAMDLRPEDRYATPRALAEDIERWMADEPVAAWPEPWWRRVRRRAKRHRTAVTATAAVLLLAIFLGAAGWRWVERQRIGRLTELTARVRAALQGASRLRGRAQAEAGDLAAWVEAESAAQTAHALLEPNLDPVLRREVETLLAEVAAERRRADAAVQAAAADRRLLERLVDIRSSQVDDRDGSETETAYAEAFRAVGIDLPPRLTAAMQHTSVVRGGKGLAGDEGAPQDPAQAQQPRALAVPPPIPVEAVEGARIRNRPADVALALAAALDDWAAVRRDKRKDADGARRLGAAARLADPDPWRRDLRAALDHPAKEARLAALRALARGARFEVLGPISLDLLGRALGASGDSERARAVLRAAQHYHPDDVWINYDLAQELEKMGRREGAIRCYAAARAIRTETAHSLAHALSRNGEPDEAIEVFQDLVRLRPENPRHLGCLGRELKARGRSREADAALDAAHAKLDALIRSKPDAWAHFSLGYVLLGKGRTDQAIAEYREAIRLQPDHVSAHHNLAEALRERGRFDEAIPEYREAIRLQPDLVAAHHDLSNAFKQMGRLDEAIAEYREVIRLQPDHAQVHFNLGNLLREKSRVDEEIAEYREAIRLQPDHVSAHHNLANALRATGRLDEAIAECRIAVRLQPDRARTHVNFGNVLRDKGRFEEGIAEFREAIRLQPDLAAAHNILAWALATDADPRRRDPAEALEHARKAVKRNPGDGNFQNTLGAAEYRAGNWGPAIAALRKSMELRQGGDALDWFFLSLAQKRLGHHEEAGAWFDKAVKWTRQHDPRNGELRQFWSEAAELLGRPGPDDTAPGAPAGQESKPRG